MEWDTAKGFISRDPTLTVFPVFRVSNLRSMGVSLRSIIGLS